MKIQKLLAIIITCNINFQLKYTDVSVAKYESHKPNLIHNTVNHSIIDVRVCPEGKEVK